MHQFAQAWLVLIVDISIKSMLLAGVAGLALVVLRLRDTNLRHRVWTAVLLGMLAMPALVYVTPAVPLPGWLVLVISVASTEPNPIGDRPDDTLVANLPWNSLDASGEGPHVADSNSDAFTNSAMNEPSPYAQRAMQPPDGLDSPKANPIADDIQTAEQPSIAVQLASQWSLALASLYLSVAVVFVVRLLVGLTLTHRLIGQAREIHLAVPLALPRRRSLRLLESTSVHVPATVGFVRPVVLLPISWRRWTESKLQAVLAHELAHVRRADWLVITLAELNRALYWFHPVAWIIRRRLSELAERNCDDSVLEADGDRTQYARYLLEVASSLTSAGSRYTPPLHGIAMARKPNVETRIDAILDASRPLARRIGALGVICLFAIGVPAILLAAALQPATEDTNQKSETAEATANADENTKDGNAKDQAEPVPDGRFQHVKGRVLGPTGEPVAGATVYAAWGLMRRDPPSQRIEHKIIAQTKSDAQGNFELQFSTEHPDMTRLATGWHLAAFAPGLSLAWQRDVHVVKDASAKSTTTLTLTSDQPIRGRVVDLEGNPLAAVQVRIHALLPPEGERAILAWIQEAKEKSPPSKIDDYFENGFRMSGGSRKNSPYASAFPTRSDDGGLAHGSPALPVDAETDKDGRFQFDRLGANRLAILEFEGPAIAKCLVHVVTRDMDTISAQPLISLGVRAGTYYGRDFQFVAEPTQPIVGTVTDAETGQPLANFEVHVEQFAGNLFSQDDFLATRTDEQGHYKLTGAPSGGGHRIEVSPSPDQPYFPTKKKLDKASGFDPITFDFALRRGQWIVGKVTDRESRTPIKEAIVEYLPLRSNEHAQDFLNYDPKITGHVPSNRYRTSEGGAFRVLAIPGAGILVAIAQGDGQHTYSSLSPDVVPKHLLGNRGSLNTYHPWIVTGYHALREVKLSKSNVEVAYDLEFTRGLSRVVKLVDAQGQAVKGIRVLGRSFPPRFEEPANDSAVEIIGLRLNDERDVVFIHPDQRIGKAVTISAGEETTVQLESCAVARGRVFDDEGQPVRGLEVNVTIDRPDTWNRSLIGAATGEDGRFEVLLPPGTTYRIWHYSKNAPQFSAECQSQPGAVFELGDLAKGIKLGVEQTEKLIVAEKIGARSKGEAPQVKATGIPATTPAPATPARIQLSGRVVRPDGQPAAGTSVYLLQDSPMVTQPVAVVQTNADGGFAFDVGKDVFNVDETSEPWLIAKVLAKADGFGPAWALAASFDPREKMAKHLPLYPSLRDRRGELVADQTLRLVADDVPIEGRIVSIEGHPIAGARVRVMGIDRTGQPTLDSWLTAVEDQHTAFDKAWKQLRVETGFNFRRQVERLFPDIKSDKDGRFRLAGVGRESIVALQIEGPGIETRQVSARTRKGETVRIADRRFKSEQAKMYYGSNFDHVAGPSRPVKGVARDKDTRQPLPGVKVQAYRLAGVGVQPYPNAMFYTLTDTEGRYQLDGLPVGGNELLAIGPASEPYIVSALPAEVNPDQTETTVDFALKRGVWIRGRVTDASDGRPLRANVYYAVFLDNSRSQEAPGYSDAFSLWHHTDADGRFQMPGFVGRGIVGVRASNSSDYPKGVGADRIEGRETSNGWTHFRTEPSFGWAENYHAVAAVTPDESGANNECNFALVPGGKMRGNLFDSAGDPLRGAMILGAVEGSVWQPLEDASFTVRNVDPLKPRRVQFLHSERNLAGSVTVKGDEAGPINVKLEPWATITGRIVDTVGDPFQSASLASDEGDKQQLGAMPGHFDFAADAEGRFKIEGLAPRLPYDLRVIVPGRSLGTVVKDLQLSPGETKDLGDLSVKRPGN